MTRKRTLLDTVRAWARLRAALSTRNGPGTQRALSRPSLLLLAWEFPPRLTSGSFRPGSLARYAAEAGWEVKVATGPAETSTTQAGIELANAIPDTVRVENVVEDTLSPSYKLFQHWLPTIHGGMWNAVLLHEAARRVCDSDAPDVVFASGPRFCSFVAARSLMHRYNCPLVLEYRDEWSESAFSYVPKHPDDQRWEARCARDASLIIFTTASQRENFLRAFPNSTAEDCIVIPNGYEEDHLTGTISSSEAASMLGGKTQINLGFFGTLGPHQRPRSFLSTLEAVIERLPSLRNHLALNFVGFVRPGPAEDDLNAFPAPNMIRRHGHVAASISTALMQHVSALILINDSEMARSIPGKLYYYLASGRPVIVYGTGGEIARIIEKFSAGVVIPSDDPDALIAALNQIQSWSPAPSPELSEWLRGHTRKSLANRTICELESFVATTAAQGSQ